MPLEAVVFRERELEVRWKGYSKLTLEKRPIEKLMIGGPKVKGLRFIHWSQIPAGFRSNPSKRWVITIHYKEEVSPS